MSTIPKLFLDNRVSVSDVNTSVVRISGNQVNYFQINPDGSGFNSTITFNNVITPSLNNTLISKNIRIRYSVRLTATGDSQLPKPAGSAFAQIQGALRAYPLQSICTSSTLQINGTSTVLSSRAVLSALQRTQKKSLQQSYETEAPTQADNLALLVPDLAGGSQVNGYCSSGQVLSSYLNSPNADTRGCFIATSYDAVAHAYVFDVVESLMIPPLTSEANENALPNVNTLSVNLVLGNLLDMFCFGSIGGANPIFPAGAAVVISEPKLDLTYFSVPASLVKIPRLYETDYSNIVYFPRTQSQTLSNANAGFIQAQSDTLRLTSTPAMIYIFLRPQLSSTRDLAVAGGTSWADFFFQLGTGNTATLPGINITFGNRSGLLSSMDVPTAYRMAVRNGYTGTYREWMNAGCMLIINPVLDLGIGADDTIPGETGSVNLQVQASFCNANLLTANAYAGGNYGTANIPTELVIVVVYSGKAVLTADNCVLTTGFLSSAEVNQLLNEAPKTGEVMSDEVLAPSIGGKGLFGKAKSIMGHVARGIGAAAPILSKIADSSIVKGLAKQRAGVLSMA